MQSGEKIAMAKKMRNFATIMAISAVVGTMLLVLVFLLPVGPMRRNVEKSVGDMLKTGDEIPEDAFSKYLWKNRETYTDAIMVQNAIERLPDKNAYEHAMWMYHYDLEEDVWTPEDSLKAFCESHENVNNMYLHIYARYWHGYLLYLKPLLLLFSWKHVVWLELAVQIALMIWVLITAIRKQNAGVAAVTLGSFLFMKPVLVLISLTMSVCWILTLLAVEYMLLHHDRLHEKGQYPEFFLIIGILTSYFDFLTYPITTLGIPLCCYFLLENDRAWNNIKKLIGFCASWGIGYAGMWAAKWVIADLTLHTGTIKDAIWSIIGRTEAIGGRPRMNGGFYVIGLNLHEYPVYMGIAARHPGRSGSRTDGDDHCYGKMEECVCTVTSGRCHSRNSFCLDHCRTTSFCAACKVYLPDFERCGGCSHYFYCFDCQKRKKVSKKLKKIEKSVRIRLQRKDRHAIM